MQQTLGSHGLAHAAIIIIMGRRTIVRCNKSAKGKVRAAVAVMEGVKCVGESGVLAALGA